MGLELGRRERAGEGDRVDESEHLDVVVQRGEVAIADGGPDDGQRGPGAIELAVGRHHRHQIMRRLVGGDLSDVEEHGTTCGRLGRLEAAKECGVGRLVDLSHVVQEGGDCRR